METRAAHQTIVGSIAPTEHRTVRSKVTMMSLLLAASGALGGCTSGPELAPGEEAQFGEASAAQSSPGPWVIPPGTYAIADPQWVDYEPAGPWDGGAHCYGSLTPGTQVLRQYLLDRFPAISSIGGYNCAPGVAFPDRMGIHGTGRAIDVMIPEVGGSADNDAGDPVGNFLLANQELIGVQYVIWDGWDWVSSHSPGDHDGPYTGSSNMHENHLHVELSPTSHVMHDTTNWFENAVVVPEELNCPVAAAGALIDDDNPCVVFLGNPDYWRHEQGVGYQGGGLYWTNAWDNDTPGNWALWNLSFAEAGSYLIEIYLDPAFAIASDVRYEVRHGSAQDVVYVDQSSGSGWVKLDTPGTFDFSAGEDQWIAVYDDQLGVAANQHLVVDALRLTRQGLPPPGDGGAGGAPATPSEGGNVALGGATSTWPSQGGGDVALGGAASTSPLTLPPSDGSSDGYAEASCAVAPPPTNSRGATAFYSVASLIAFGRLSRARRRRHD